MAFDYDDDEKPKNEFQLHPRRTFDDGYYQEPVRERTQAATIILLALIGWSLFQMFITWVSTDEIIASAGEANEGLIQFAVYLDMFLGVMVLLGVWAAWNWKKWGYQLLIFVYAINLVFTLCGGNILGLVINGGIVFLIYKVIGDISDMMD